MILLQCAWAEATREAGRNNRRLVFFQALVLALALVLVFVLFVGDDGLFAFGTWWKPSESRSGSEYDEDPGKLLLHAR